MNGSKPADSPKVIHRNSKSPKSDCCWRPVRETNWCRRRERERYVMSRSQDRRTGLNRSHPIGQPQGAQIHRFVENGQRADGRAKGSFCRRSIIRAGRAQSSVSRGLITLRGECFRSGPVNDFYVVRGSITYSITLHVSGVQPATSAPMPRRSRTSSADRGSAHDTLSTCLLPGRHLI